MARKAKTKTKKPIGSRETCARKILETVPQAMQFLRWEMRAEAVEGLSVPQFRMLAFLGRSPGSSLSKAADFVGVADATASAMVERLVRRGLVLREGDPKERRRVMLKLTEEGSTLLDRARIRTRTSVAKCLAVLSNSELACLAEGLDLLRRVLDASVVEP